MPFFLCPLRRMGTDLWRTFGALFGALFVANPLPPTPFQNLCKFLLPALLQKLVGETILIFAGTCGIVGRNSAGVFGPTTERLRHFGDNFGAFPVRKFENFWGLLPMKSGGASLIGKPLTSTLLACTSEWFLAATSLERFSCH